MYHFLYIFPFVLFSVGLKEVHTFHSVLSIAQLTSSSIVLVSCKDGRGEEEEEH